MSEKRRGLGRGLGALIPSGTTAVKAGGDRPVDVFFDGGSTAPAPAEGFTGNGAADSGDAAASGPSAGPTIDLDRTEQGRPSDEGFTGNGAGTVDVDLVPVPGARFAELPLDAIRPNPRQPRQVFDEDAMAELAHSVREIGLLQPVVVRSVPGTTSQPRYELVMGERRWRAMQLAGLDRIPAIVRETSDDILLRDALLENLHRSQLNPLEEAAAYQQLLEDFGCTHEELASRIGRSRPQISNMIRLLRLPPAVQRRVAAGVLSAGHARALLGLDDADAMERLAGRIVSEGLSVRATEETVALTDAAPAADPARKRPRAGSRHAELDDVAVRLADRLDTRVTLALGRSKGRLCVEFASVEDLNRILDILLPGDPGAFRRS